MVTNVTTELRKPRPYTAVPPLSECGCWYSEPGGRGLRIVPLRKCDRCFRTHRILQSRERRAGTCRHVERYRTIPLLWSMDAKFPNMENRRMGEPMADRVASNVRRLRQHEGLTLEQLSAMLGDLGRPLGVTTLSKIELGQRGIDVDDLVALGLALNVPLDQLLADTSSEVIQQAEALLGEWRERSAEERAVYRRYAERTQAAWAAILDFAASSSDAYVAVDSHLVSKIDRRLPPPAELAKLKRVMADGSNPASSSSMGGS